MHEAACRSLRIAMLYVEHLAVTPVRLPGVLHAAANVELTETLLRLGKLRRPVQCREMHRFSFDNLYFVLFHCILPSIQE